MNTDQLHLTEEILLKRYDKDAVYKIMHSPDTTPRELVRALACEDFVYFCQFFLSEYFNVPYGPMHYEVAKDIELAMFRQDGWREVLAWPRGFGKTSHACTGLGVWNCATGKKAYQIIIKDSFTQAELEVTAIREELEQNETLLQYFGPFKGRMWGKGSLITAGRWAPDKLCCGGVRVEALGAGSKIRGRKHGPHRPGIVVMDDLENLESVESRPRRDKIRDWHDRAAMKAGLKAGQDTCIYFDIGSKIHSDCLISHLLKRPMWQHRFWQAELNLATNQILWDEWKKVIFDFANDFRVEAGREFFERRKVDMLKGTEVSWPEGYPYYTLQLIKIGEQKVGEDKVSSFAAEMQNEPISAEDRYFTVKHFFHFEDRDGELWIVPDSWGRAWRFKDGTNYGACDPSMGETGSADYSAIGIMNVSPWGQKAVVVADIKRRHPDRIIDDMLKYAAGRDLEAFGIESVGFQKLVFTDAAKAAAEKQDYVPFLPIPATGNKNARIKSLQPDLAAGYILLHKDHILLNEQLDDVPKSAYDDGPDMLEMLNRIASLAGAGGGLMV